MKPHAENRNVGSGSPNPSPYVQGKTPYHISQLLIGLRQKDNATLLFLNSHRSRGSRLPVQANELPTPISVNSDILPGTSKP